MILGFTGHRLKYFEGDPDHIKQRLYDQAVAILRHYEPSKVISGMETSGWDMAVAKAAQALNVPLIAAVPFPSHSKVYPELVEYAKATGAVHFINDDPYADWKMLRRNEWIVDNCDRLIALWSGRSGGTEHTWMYAEEVGRDRVNLWKNWEKYT